jgi:hypothetical protein
MKSAPRVTIQSREDLVRFHLALDQNHDVDALSVGQAGVSAGQRLAVNIPKQNLVLGTE